MKIKYFSYYDYFPHYKPEDGEPYVPIYNDNFVLQKVEPNSVAMLIEPRSIQPHIYTYMEEEGHSKFRYIFTHDSKLMKMFPEKTRFVSNFSVYDWSDEPKTKYVSIVSSDKEMCELHKVRKQLAMDMKEHPLVDTFGTFDGGEFVDCKTVHAPYMFSIAVENYLDDYWFTEKICNCFANKTVPIYIGSPKIYKFFNPHGIIALEPDGVKEWLRYATPDILKGEYLRRLDAINDNYERVRKYADFEKWFVNEYRETLDDLYSQAQKIR